ncbi:MAG: enoyl-CoA hydratase/isomerase family protein [Acetobacteraceae bacterium]|nr:enoyl-CoA hydratase/isomerase family protein [Acetobacteraceae bacterium]
MNLEPSVVAIRDGRVGRLLLNRPKALNALTLEMVRLIDRALAEWRDDPSVHAVLIEGAGNRAFCAGGDIRAVRNAALAGDAEAVEEFFAAEYALNRTIAEYPKPYVALIDGICMGGGIGVSVHGRYRVATESAEFAMPETGIGFFPDIGASYFLPRLPGKLGFYLGLTGARLLGADAVHAGLATHFVPHERLSALAAAMAEDGVAVIAAFAEKLPPFSLAPHRACIDRCFGAESVVAILAALAAEETEFARQALTAMRRASPASLLWSFEILRRGVHSELAQCLKTELALSRHVSRHPDFAEGVRAMVVDKDRNPRWSAASVEKVDPAAIAAMFA